MGENGAGWKVQAELADLVNFDWTLAAGFQLLFQTSRNRLAGGSRRRR